ncbi:hypothetical protein AVEN_160745-1 [Araneus ventricosus]|uniref:Uncharacterized protein n=1 Tax=Araneus ventricosus TaxID=182803 RepID=A0A4Y2GA81_ARAVE|nr:hypothetical protein AVEN_160745-1 [Araneus ventricosus]
MSKRGNSPCFEDDDGNDHLFISLDENPPKRFHWGPAMMYAPERHTVATPKMRSTEPSATTPEVCFAQPSTTAAPQPSTAAGSPLGRDERRRAYKTVGSWELGGGIKAFVVQSSDGGAFVNIR